MFLDWFYFTALFTFSCANSIFFYYISFKVNSNVYYLSHLIILSPFYMLDNSCIYFSTWTFKSSSPVQKIVYWIVAGLHEPCIITVIKTFFFNKKKSSMVKSTEVISTIERTMQSRFPIDCMKNTSDEC